MKVYTLLAGILWSALVVTGCHTARKSGKAMQDAACRNAPLAPGDPSVGWQKTPPPSPGAAQAVILPKRFDSYAIKKEELDAFFSHAKKTGTASGFAIPLPESLGCQYFEVTPSDALPEGLAEKFPDMASLKGTAVYNRDADLRLDYDGTKLRAQVLWHDAVYLVMPVQQGNDVVYIVYNKKDSGEQKHPFEQKVNPAMNTAPVQQPAQQQMGTAPLPVR